MTMFRQGDVLIVNVNTEIPKDAKPVDHCTLALGEMTGHSHRIATGAKMYVDGNGLQFIEVLGKSAEVLHEEHGTISLPGPGVYRIDHQREYQPSGIRNVQD